MSTYDEQSPSYRNSLIGAGRGHLLSDGPGRATRSFPPPEIIEDVACIYCESAARMKHSDLCVSCQSDLADDLAERDRCGEHAGTRCSDACGHCGFCG